MQSGIISAINVQKFLMFSEGHHHTAYLVEKKIKFGIAKAYFYLKCVKIFLIINVAFSRSSPHEQTCHTNIIMLLSTLDVM